MTDRRFTRNWNALPGRLLFVFALMIVALAALPKIWPEIKKFTYGFGDLIAPVGDIGFIAFIICTSMLIQMSISVNKTSMAIGFFLLLIFLLVVWTEQDTRQSLYGFSSGWTQSRGVEINGFDPAELESSQSFTRPGSR